MAEDDEASGGSPRLQGTGTRGRDHIRLVKPCDGDRGAGAAVSRPDDRTRPVRRQREALVRAEVAVCALRDARRTRDLGARRQLLALAKSALVKAVGCVIEDLEKIPA